MNTSLRPLAGVLAVAASISLILAYPAGAASPTPIPSPASSWRGWWSTVQIAAPAPECREVTIPADVMFGGDNPTPGQGLEGVVVEVAKVAAEVPGPILIEGFTAGNGAGTESLSQARADNVLAAVTRAGVDPSRLIAAGRGGADPVASNDTESGRAQNRRVTVRVGRCT